MKHIFIFDGEKMDKDLKDMLLEKGCLGWINGEQGLEGITEGLKTFVAEKEE